MHLVSAQTLSFLTAGQGWQQIICTHYWFEKFWRSEGTFLKCFWQNLLGGGANEWVNMQQWSSRIQIFPGISGRRLVSSAAQGKLNRVSRTLERKRLLSVADLLSAITTECQLLLECHQFRSNSSQILEFCRYCPDPIVDGDAIRSGASCWSRLSFACCDSASSITSLNSSGLPWTGVVQSSLLEPSWARDLFRRAEFFQSIMVWANLTSFH